MNTASQLGQTSDPVSTAATADDDMHPHRNNDVHPHGNQRIKKKRMVIGRVDQVSSFLMALIVFIGSAVAMMLVAWMITPPQSTTTEPFTTVTSVTSGSAGGLDLEFEEPSPAEVEVLREPSLEEVVQQITDLPSDTLALTSDTPALKDESNGFGETSTRPPGPGEVDGPGAPEAIAPYERWVLNFAASSEKEFAAQLAALEIELGVFGGGRKGIDYAAAPFIASTIRHNADPTSEKRMYFSWHRATPLLGYERSLIKRAGIVSRGRVLVKFITLELEKSLAIKELEYAQKYGVNEVTAIAKTVFECRANDRGYDFVVIDQRYRK